MKRLMSLILVAAGILAAGSAAAETIIFKDGTSIKGKIIEDGNFYIKVMEEGELPKQYYKELIEEIMEDPELYEWNPELINASGFEGISPAKVLLIIEHMEANGARYNVQRNMEIISEKATDDMKIQLKKVLNIHDVMSQLIPVYDQVYSSEQELREINAFLKSPAGSKFIGATPEIMKASVTVMTDYFRSRLGGELRM